MTKIKHVELFVDKGCESCDIALYMVAPVAKKYGVPLVVLPAHEDVGIVPVTCVVEQKNGELDSNCVEGIDENLPREIEELLEG